jgi:hypothetical protein
MSLWSVDDEATSYLMQGYYKRLGQSRGRSESLRDVQREMASSKRTQHPYYWAAFIPSGDPGSMSLVDESYVAPNAPSGPSKDSPPKKKDDDERKPKPISEPHFDIAGHYMATTNLRDQPDREGGFASMSLDVPLVSDWLSGRTVGVHDSALASLYAGFRTSTGTPYGNDEKEGSFGFGMRLGYELALGARTSDFGVFAGAQAMYNTFVLGDIRTYGVTAPLLGIVRVKIADVPFELRGTYGKWLVDQEVAGASLKIVFKSMDVRFGAEQLKMPVSVSLDGDEQRASAGRQVSNMGTIAFGATL